MFKWPFINNNQIEMPSNVKIFVTSQRKIEKKNENKNDALPQNELTLSNRLMKFYLIGSVAAIVRNLGRIIGLTTQYT